MRRRARDGRRGRSISRKQAHVQALMDSEGGFGGSTAFDSHIFSSGKGAGASGGLDSNGMSAGFRIGMTDDADGSMAGSEFGAYHPADPRALRALTSASKGKGGGVDPAHGGDRL